MKKIIFLLLFLLIPLQSIFACGWIEEFELKKYKEKGTFESFGKYGNFSDSMPCFFFDSLKYPNAEIFINTEKIDTKKISKNQKILFCLFDFVDKPKIDVSVKQNGIEIYSAKWKVSTNSNFFKNIFPGIIIFIFLVLVILFLIKINKNTKIRIILLICLLLLFFSIYKAYQEYQVMFC